MSETSDAEMSLGNDVHQIQNHSCCRK